MKKTDVRNKKSVLTDKELKVLIEMGLTIKQQNEHYVQLEYRNAEFNVLFAGKYVKSEFIKDEATSDIIFITLDINGEPFAEKEGVLPVVLIKNMIKKYAGKKIIE